MMIRLCTTRASLCRDRLWPEVFRWFDTGLELDMGMQPHTLAVYRRGGVAGTAVICT